MDKPSLCLVAGIPPTNLLISKFISVLEPLVSDMVVITGNYHEYNSLRKNTHIVNVGSFKVGGLIFSIFSTLILQLKYSYYLLKNIRKFKIVVFFLGGSAFFLPIVISRIFKKNTVFVVTHSTAKIAQRIYTYQIIPIMTRFLERLNFGFCHKLVVYSPNMCKDLGLEHYRNKIVIAYEHYVNYSLFNKVKPRDKRNYSIGFVGRLSREKGILNLIQSMRLVPSNINLIICGDGELRNDIESFVKTNDLCERVNLVGWVPNEELPKYLNDMKILVIPSYTEGLVNVMYESMACETPVVASPVGAIPDFICDEETGFLLESNDPKDIAKGIVKALMHPRLDEVAVKSRVFVKNHFSFEKAVERYQQIVGYSSWR